MITSKDNSFEENFNGIETSDRKKLATTMDKDEDSNLNFCLNNKNGEILGRSLSSLLKIVLYMIRKCNTLINKEL